MHEAQAVVRRALSPRRILGPSQPQRWRTLWRWVGVVVEGRLFAEVRLAPGGEVRALAGLDMHATGRPS